jgi:hypothetical protein
LHQSLGKTPGSVADLVYKQFVCYANPDPKYAGMILALSNVLSGHRCCLFYFLISGTEPTVTGINAPGCLINYKTKIKVKKCLIFRRRRPLLRMV